MCLMAGMKHMTDLGRTLANTHALQSPSTRGAASHHNHISCVKCGLALIISVTPRFLHGKKEEHYLGDTAEMKCSPGFVTVALFMLGK